MNKNYEELSKKIEKCMAFQAALTLFEWDAETLAPEESMEYTSKTIGILSNEFFTSLINDEVKKLIRKLSDDKEHETLDFNQKAIVKEIKKSIEELEHIPPEEYQAFSELTAKASGIWSRAKNKKSFADFSETLDEIIMYRKKFAGYRAKNKEKLYDILLNDFEEGFNMEKLDEFFGKIKEAVIPLLKEVTKRKDTIDKSYNHKYYDVEKQKEFCRYVSGYVGFDFNRGVIAESAHPFTTNLHNHDVRITNHFHEDNLESAIFSIIHESGHGIYEMHIDDAITQTPVGTGTSMGMHESQSRFFENVIGRSEAFWKPLFPKLKETFPEQLKEVTLEHFIKGINKAAPGFIRTEADELSYSLHIIIRYEIEKMIFADELKIEDLPKVWNEKYKKYMGIEPENDAIGVLQDIHWAGGSFGYFPSYAIGSAIAAQIYYHMNSIMPIDEYLTAGNLTPIREYLNNHIHKYGKTKNTNEILTEMMGEELNADYYVKYLTEKYNKLYELN
ncbi:carboxypeptidase M32 [Anaerocolumna sp. AGMB13025]|uniref:carboxypeptidase M32 n=1 Tax=Anaerocolumna sp. AGMB13025 TaxID=3039116 RepID=UPI00241F403E|nr:carboxypeptidase M32 [Anaerocolumna sp. AGMB13025]WFR59743.1 carboxypeptidase M32 [Anaerocolumna sp. AGMB13025]